MHWYEANRWSKKAVAMILAGSIATSSLVAAPAAAFADTASVTITSTQGAVTTYDAYCFFKADIADDNNKASHVEWALSGEQQAALITYLGDGYTTWLKNNSHTEEGAAKLAQNALEYISQSISSSTGKSGKDPKWVDADTFAMNLATWAKTNLTATGTATAGAAYTGDEGYYLFLTNAGSIDKSSYLATLPIWFPLGGSSTEIAEKTAPVSVTKQVKEGSEWKGYADAEIGKAVEYRIQAKVPANYNGFSRFKVVIEDALPADMKLDTSSVKIFVGDENGTDVTASFNTNASAAKKLSVMCDNTKGIQALSADDVITVTYTASLTDSAVTGGTGNASAATYTYSNDPQADTTSSVTSDSVELYTYQASIDKTDKVTNEVLQGAQFVIKNASDKYLSANNAWDADGRASARVFTTDDQGVITGIVGLDAGTYTIEEVKAPDGYSLPANTSITLKVTPTYNTDGELGELKCEVTSAFATPDKDKAADTTTGNVNIDVTNDKVFSLAVTGAAGVGVGGAAVLALGLGWYLVRAHRKGNEQE